MTSQLGDDRGDQGAGVQEVDFLKWTCERLLEIFEKENERRRSLEAKALGAASALVVLVGILSQVVKPDEVEHPWLFVVGTGFAALTLMFAVVATAVSRAPDVSPTQFYTRELLAYPVSNRLRSLAQHIVETIKLERTRLKKKAFPILATQFSAYAGSLVFLVGLLFG